ncbi:MAG: V-type ATP synthase subunit D [Christensenellales bacterium]|jgi:V/A-type H+-transporting ATPase subunit D
MPKLNVNPTRMELQRLKARLVTAQRGHKLLKDKSDEMVRRFMLLIKECYKLRKEVEAELSLVLKGFMLCSAVNSPAVIEEAVAMPGTRLLLEASYKNIMGVRVPRIEISHSRGSIYPYSFASVSSELDEAIAALTRFLPRLLQLSETEKACNMLADEIQKNRRRVNALEYVVIPEVQEAIKFIKMKLDENERASTIRLIKVKDLIQKNSL